MRPLVPFLTSTCCKKITKHKPAKMHIALHLYYNRCITCPLLGCANS